MRHYQLGDAVTDLESWLNNVANTPIGGCSDPAAPFQCDSNNPFYSIQCPNGTALACSSTGSSYEACSTQADNDPNYTSISSLHDNVQTNWQPTGYYNPSDIQSVVAQQQALAAQALSLVQSTMTTCQNAPGCGSGDLLAQMQYNLMSQPSDSTNIMTQAQTFLASASSAQSSITSVITNGYVQAPGFKAWVLRSLDTIGDAVHAALVVQCQMPSWAAAISTVVSAAQSFANAVMSVLGVAANIVSDAVAAGTAIVQTTAAGVTVLGWVIANLPLLTGLIVLAAGGVYAYRRGWLPFSRKRSLGFSRGYGKYEVEGQLFEDKNRAKAMAKLRSREYGFPVSVREGSRKVATYANGHAV